MMYKLLLTRRTDILNQIFIGVNKEAPLLYGMKSPKYIPRSFAVGCLEKYREDKRVWGISGYAWPMALSQENASDVYACGFL